MLGSEIVRKRMRLLGRVVAIVLSLALVGCTHWREQYFDDAVDRLTQADIRKKLGKPHIVKQSLLDSQTTWIYRYALTESELDPWGLQSVSKGVNEVGNTAASLIGRGSQNTLKRETVHCFKYILTFDEDQVLRTWEREPC